GRSVKADEALRIGLTDELVASEVLHERALALAADVARGALHAQAMIKRAVDTGADESLEDALKLERNLFEAIFHTADSEIGVRSFLEHGPGKAQFTGA
ncbi:MAG: enoyl-CoA hydratase/isomerase family protein, partial [Ilumatobacteraceae bacterium]